MAHNSLRRAIATELGVELVQENTAASAIMARILLARALAALGGPVAAQQIPPRVAVVPFTKELTKALDDFSGDVSLTLQPPPIAAIALMTAAGLMANTPRCPVNEAGNALRSTGDPNEYAVFPGCPPVDAVSSVEGGTECNREYDRLDRDDDVPELRYDHLHGFRDNPDDDHSG